MKEGVIPDKVFNQDKAMEMIRFWMLEGESHLFLRTNYFSEKHEARMFGFMLADIAKHAVEAMRLSDPSLGSEETILAQIESGYLERLKHTPEMSGQILGARH